MSRVQDITAEALARGRLIFPHYDEMRQLQKLGKKGPLTKGESFRLAGLTEAHTKISQKDAWFHSQMLAGDHAAAALTAQAALKDLQEIP